MHPAARLTDSINFGVSSRGGQTESESVLSRPSRKTQRMHIENRSFASILFLIIITPNRRRCVDILRCCCCNYPKNRWSSRPAGHTSVTVGVDTIEQHPASVPTPFTSPTHMYTQHIKNGEYNLKKNKNLLREL